VRNANYYFIEKHFARESGRARQKQCAKQTKTNGDFLRCCGDKEADKQDVIKDSST
jgi:hypothetical protein